MKICTTCKEPKPIGAFNKNASRKDGHQTSCRACEKIRKKEYYDQNKGKFVRYARNHKIKKKEEWDAFRRGLTCVKCGEDRWYVLEFHHRDPEEKEFNLTRWFDLYGRPRMEKEMEKCDVLCANCHREAHFLLRTQLPE